VPTLVALAVTATALSLGQWQLRRADEKRALQARIDAAATEAPVSVPSSPVQASSLDGRRVLVEGRWDATHTVFVENRTYKGVAGFHVATPVRIADSQMHVLVLRGWVARDRRDRLSLPQVPAPAGIVRVEGIAQAHVDQVLELEASGLPGPQERIWQNIDLSRFARWSGLALQPVLVRQSARGAPDDGLVRDWPVPGTGVDKHIGYAFQWFALAAATVALWIYFSFFRRSERDTDR
jgi:surfeit locus 1 family protein